MSKLACLIVLAAGPALLGATHGRSAGIDPAPPGTGPSFPRITGDYFGRPHPGATPELFAPGVVSTDLHDDGAPEFTPDGNEVFPEYGEKWFESWPSYGRLRPREYLIA